MRLEVDSAVDFLMHLLRLQGRSEKVAEEEMSRFKNSITELLRRRYRDHWFPDRPNRGSGYRCIRINGKMDPVIAQACMNVGLLPTAFIRLFPAELTLWIDPAEVSYRIGESGSICVLYERKPDEEMMSQAPPPPAPNRHFESCKDSLIHKRSQFTEQQMATFVSS